MKLAFFFTMSLWQWRTQQLYNSAFGDFVFVCWFSRGYCKTRVQSIEFTKIRTRSTSERLHPPCPQEPPPNPQSELPYPDTWLTFLSMPSLSFGDFVFVGAKVSPLLLHAQCQYLHSQKD